MSHDLHAIDTIRERMGVGYETALQALDATAGDLPAALALIEHEQREGLRQLTEYVREGVKCSRGDDGVGELRWRLSDQVVAEVPLGITGWTAAVVRVLSDLISSSTIETTRVADPDAGQSGG